MLEAVVAGRETLLSEDLEVRELPLLKRVHCHQPVEHGHKELP